MKNLSVIIALLICFTPLAAEDSNIFMKYTNEKAETNVYLPSENQKYSLEKSIGLAMEAAAICNCDNGIYTAKIYKNKKALLSSSDFNDDDIYGAALSAVTEQHYGEAQIFFRGYDSGNKNLVDWDFLVLYALDDGRFLCIKILNYDTEE